MNKLAPGHGLSKREVSERVLLRGNCTKNSFLLCATYRAHVVQLAYKLLT